MNCKSNEIPQGAVKLSDKFFSRFVDTMRQNAMPYQWRMLNGEEDWLEPNYTVRNFKAAAGEIACGFGGVPFQDTDLAKWLEAAGYSLISHPDPELEALCDGIIDTIAKAQQPDGYLDTYYILEEPGGKWQNSLHELYCAGHMIEAGVAYFEATGKTKLLDVARRVADNVAAHFGPENGKAKGYIGHEGIELALVKLFGATGEQRYLELAAFFITQRRDFPEHFFKAGSEGESTVGYDYWGWDKPERPPSNLTSVAGHAVKAMYLYAGAADVAAHRGDADLLKICGDRWDTIVNRQLYITGGIGATPVEEAFTYDYDLPNGTGYAETCGSIGLIFFAFRMLKVKADSVYADVIERALYNIVPASVSLDGKRYFYVNPLEMFPEACAKDPLKMHVKPVRQKWYRCACCPPNLLRLASSLPRYIYSVCGDSLYTHLYVGNETEITLNGAMLKISQGGGYPWDGSWIVKTFCETDLNARLCFRIPGWCDNFSLELNGAKQPFTRENGYFCVAGSWAGENTIKIEMNMIPRFVHANPKVRDDAGRVAIQRGPVVYCVEEIDNGENLSAISVDTAAGLEVVMSKDIPGAGTYPAIKAKAVRRVYDGGKLYYSEAPVYQDIELRAVPYCLWCNREPGEMEVWLREKL